MRELDGVSLISDGFIPFRDNIDHAARHGVALRRRSPAARRATTRSRPPAASTASRWSTPKLRLFHH